VHGNRSRNYTYDDNGNFSSFAGQQFTYKTHNNQLINDGTRQFTYDAIGRAVTVGSDNIEYDVFSNMTGYNNDSYTYDADNQRIKKVEDNDTTYYIRDGLNTVSEYDGSGNHLADYVYGISGMAAKVDLATGYFWYYKDHLGSTRQLGSSNLFRDYYPFGMSLAESGTETDYLFSGKELDNRTGLSYFGARYYDARIGRWLVVDPAGQYWSPYVYCGNNPVITIDKDGRAGGLASLLLNPDFAIGAGIIITAATIHMSITQDMSIGDAFNEVITSTADVIENLSVPGYPSNAPLPDEGAIITTATEGAIVTATTVEAVSTNVNVGKTEVVSNQGSIVPTTIEKRTHGQKTNIVEKAKTSKTKSRIQDVKQNRKILPKETGKLPPNVPIDNDLRSQKYKDLDKLIETIGKLPLPG
jgi:RHS repeat-associated protein